MFAIIKRIKPWNIHALTRSIKGIAAVVTSNHQVSQYSTHVDGYWRPKLIIFDKNGTLFNFHTTWSPWIQSFCNRLSQTTGRPLTKQLYQRLDVCLYTHKTRSGILGHGTDYQIKNEIVKVLEESGISAQKAPGIVERCWKESGFDMPKEFIENPDLSGLFQQLKNQNMQIAVCTSENRTNVTKDFEKLGMLPFIDSLICGDDTESFPKPDVRNIEKIYSDTGVSASDTVIVGDTEADVKMGYDAGVALTVGVLSGIGTRLDLAQYSDYIFDDVNEFVKRVLKTEDCMSEKDPLMKRLRASLNNSKTKASLVIFDKDGTLLCFNSMWTPWLENVISRIEKDTGFSLKNEIMQELGFCSEKQKWVPGLLAEGTQHQNKERVKDVLKSRGLDKTDALNLIESAWDEADSMKSQSSCKLLDNPQSLFKTLKDNGLKIAICTADSREGTLDFVKSMGVEDLVDLVVCGDDPQAVPKPAPQNAMEICRTLGVDPSRAVMVGDTHADMGMGKSAKLGATVAVLSGVGNVEHLDASADHVIPSIGHLLPILFDTDIPKGSLSRA